MSNATKLLPLAGLRKEVCIYLTEAHTPIQVQQLLL